MNDQAQSLRNSLEQMAEGKKAKIIAVVSGKGGVGKSNVSLNFSIELSRKGHKILLLDMDVGMGNIDILLGQPSGKSIVDVFTGKVDISEVLVKGPGNIFYVPGGTGLSRLFQVQTSHMEFFIKQLYSIIDDYDYVIFDLGAGMSESYLRLLLSVNEVIIITTPEPTAITDAYATMKYIHARETDAVFFLIVNKAYSNEAGKGVLIRLSKAAQQFLQKKIVDLGIIPEDKAVPKSVNRQVPFLIAEPNAKASRALQEIVAKYANLTYGEVSDKRAVSFFSKLKNYFKER